MKIFRLMTVLFGLFLATGCTAPTAGTRVESYNSDKIIETRFVVRKRLRIEDVRRSMSNGLLHVDISAVSQGHFFTPFASFGRKPYQYEYRFRWLDENRMEVDGGRSTWRSIVVDARDKVHMQGTAPSSAATDFEFVVRFPDRF